MFFWNNIPKSPISKPKTDICNQQSKNHQFRYTARHFLTGNSEVVNMFYPRDTEISSPQTNLDLPI